MKKILILCAIFGLLAISYAGAEGPKTLEEAKVLATQQGKPILIDFSTSWCRYCKLFAKDSKNDAEIMKALESVVLFETDAEKGEGKTLAAQYKVKGYPTFVLINPTDKVIDLWAGYEKAYFLKVFGEAVANLAPVEEKITRYGATPNLKDALGLGRYYESIGQYKSAADCYNTAQKLRTDASDDYTFEAFEVTVEGFNNNVLTINEVVSAADAVLASNDKTPTDVIETAQLMIGVDKQDNKMDIVQKYLEAALKVSADSKDEKIKEAHNGILVDYNLFVKNDTTAAVAQKKANMPKGWINDVSALNEFCWWCFESNINLADAEDLARHGVDIAEPGKNKAMIADTAAEIFNARGNRKDAIKFANIAAQEDPESKYYPKQLEKFQKEASKK
jgi:thioredoxin-related protein